MELDGKPRSFISRASVNFLVMGKSSMRLSSKYGGVKKGDWFRRRKPRGSLLSPGTQIARNEALGHYLEVSIVKV